MSYLDTYVPHLHKSANQYSNSTEAMNAAITQAEHKAHTMLAHNKGDHSQAFQIAHAKFVEAAHKTRFLLHQASENISTAGSHYLHADQEAAGDIANTIID